MLSKVGEIVFFVVTKSSGESCASLEMCVDSFFSFPWGSRVSKQAGERCLVRRL